MNPNKNISESLRISHDLCCWCSCLCLLINSNTITRVHPTGLKEVTGIACLMFQCFCHSATLRCHRYHFLREDKYPFIQYSQYCCWWLDNLRSQGIMSHSIDLVLWNILTSALEGLTHLPLDKMAVISQTTFSSAISMIESFLILIQISLKVVPEGPIDNKAALFQVMAWCRTGTKPLPEPMLTQLTGAYMCHSGEMS